tara:strand:- start:912 stop:1871 length:960 start_codon:yes stop_codon:yes gene_type:complete
MNKKDVSQISNWLNEIIKGSFHIELASSDASFRTYYRINYNEGTDIVMHAPPDKESLTDVIKINTKLEDANITVPKIKKVNEDLGLILMSDFGKKVYLDNLNNETVFCLYTDAIDVIHNMQNNISTSDLECFDIRAQKDEVNLFIDWFLKKHIGYDDKKLGDIGIEEMLTDLLEKIDEIPKKFIHRDYHSRNLMLLEKGNPGVLDYQDAMTGPITYDLVSLLKDCYIKWDDELIKKMSKTYFQRADSKTSFDVFNYWFDISGLQRHLKAIGIFSRLNYRDNKPAYMNDIPRTLSYIRETVGKYDELKEIKLVLDELRLE